MDVFELAIASPIIEGQRFHPVSACEAAGKVVAQRSPARAHARVGAAPASAAPPPTTLLPPPSLSQAIAIFGSLDEFRAEREQLILDVVNKGVHARRLVQRRDALPPNDCSRRADCIRMMTRLVECNIESGEKLLGVYDKVRRGEEGG